MLISDVINEWFKPRKAVNSSLSSVTCPKIGWLCKFETHFNLSHFKEMLLFEIVVRMCHIIWSTNDKILNVFMYWLRSVLLSLKRLETFSDYKNVPDWPQRGQQICLECGVLISWSKECCILRYFSQKYLWSHFQ